VQFICQGFESVDKLSGQVVIFIDDKRRFVRKSSVDTVPDTLIP
jgi:hypothetical protein